MKKIFLLIIIAFAGYMISTAQDSLKVNPNRDRVSGGLYGSCSFNSTYGNSVVEFGDFFDYEINKYLSVGSGLSFASIDARKLPNWTDGDNVYHIKRGEQIYNVNLLASVTGKLPVNKDGGLFLEATGLFEIVPINKVELERTNLIDESDTQYASKRVFNGFSPGLFIDIGWYFSRNEEVLTNKMLRELLGPIYICYGIGFYDPLVGYRKASLMGQDISSHMPKNKLLHRITIKWAI